MIGSPAQKKICLIGSYAVGKTNLVSRYVHGVFNDIYLTTRGVKVENKLTVADEERISLVIWDIHGEDAFQKINRTYLRGSSALLFVADGTRPGTLDKVLSLRRETMKLVEGNVPSALAINKVDLKDDWEISEGMLRAVREQDWNVAETSAKSGQSVSAIFEQLVEQMSEREQVV